jgi:hypothetical protein
MSSLTPNTEEKGKREVRIKLNFKVAQPTVNDHIYRWDIIENELKRSTQYKTGLPIVEYHTPEGIVDLKALLGFAKSYEIDEEGNIFIDFEPLSDAHSNRAEFYLNNREFTIQGFGTVNHETNEVNDDFKLICVFPTSGANTERPQHLIEEN